MASIKISAKRMGRVLVEPGPVIEPCDEDVPPAEGDGAAGFRPATVMGLGQSLVAADLTRTTDGAPAAPATTLPRFRPAAVLKTVPAEETVSVVGVSAEGAKEHPSPWFILGAYILIAAGVGLGYLLATAWLKPMTTFVVVDGIGLFAIFYIAAQALERLLEPLASLEIPDFGGSAKKEENRRDKKIRRTREILEGAGAKAEAGAGASAAADAQTTANEAASSQAKVNQIKNNTQVVTWAMASFLAMLLSGAMGLYLLEVIGVKGAPVWLNILVTGLAVGAGTEPLHKLIKLIEKKSEDKKEEA